VRQDLNISIPNGALIEIKGVQELELIGKAVQLEVDRQTCLLQIKNELKNRNVQVATITKNYLDLTEIFRDTKARVIRDAISKQGIVLGIRLEHFRSLLGKQLGVPGLRFGTELSGRASFWAGVGGIFHSDELPAYGITDVEVGLVNQKLKIDSDDAFVIVADEPARARDALNAVTERAIEAIGGVPEETRNAMPDGSSRFIRPRPGAARMYPETDVPSVPITERMISDLKSHLPEPSEHIVTRLISEYSLNKKLATQLVDSDYLALFEKTTKTTKAVQSSFVATMLTEICKNLEREGFPIHSIDDTKMEAVFKLVDEGTIAKEAMPDLLKWQAKNLDSDVREGTKALGLRMLPEPELAAIIDNHLLKNRKVVNEKGLDAFASIMGSVMSEVRGSADPKVVAEMLKIKLARKST
jgi:glutamyl-tRNA(Gln) amidotransferase subunit E